LNSGHYTCIARRGQRWLRFDDDKVTDVLMSNVCDVSVLYFRRTHARFTLTAHPRLLAHLRAQIIQTYELPISLWSSENYYGDILIRPDHSRLLFIVAML
jgi:hypothetical protein